MHPLTISKGALLLIFLCCYPHISNATGTVGQKVAEAVVGSSILGGITKTAQNAIIQTVSPFYKFFIEGGLGIVTRYFTLSDYWGIGPTIRKGLTLTASGAASATKVVGTTISKYAKKRLEEQMEEMNRWWIRKKLSALSTVASGIGGGIGWAVAENVIDKVDDNKATATTAAPTAATAAPTESTAVSSGCSNCGGSSIIVGHGDIEVSVSKPVSLSQLVLGKLPVSDETSQVIIGKPVGEVTGEADSSSTVAVWKDPFKFLFGKSESEDESTSEEESGGCSTCGKEEGGTVNVLKGKRGVRSLDDSDSLVTVFQRVEQDDPQQCLPMVLCAIHADPEGLLTPQETNLVMVFRPLVTQRHVPEWAGPWVRGARQGTAAAHGKAEEASTTCRKAFPKCPFSPHHLRTLMASTFGVDLQNKEYVKDIHLEPNVL